MTILASRISLAQGGAILLDKKSIVQKKRDRLSHFIFDNKFVIHQSISSWHALNAYCLVIYFVRLHAPVCSRSSFRHGLPESMVQGWIDLAIHGSGYPLPGEHHEPEDNLTK